MSDRVDITVQGACDILVCGSSLYAIDMAIEAASSGKRTVLAMERTNPFIECIGSLRAYVDEAYEVAVSPVMTDILSLDDYVMKDSGRRYFNPHQAALLIEDRLIEAGVVFYYNAMPVSALVNDGRIHGAVFGGKPGLFAVDAGIVIDCTLNAVIARTAGVKTIAQPPCPRASYSLELDRDYPADEFEFSDNGISGRATIHRFYADVELTLPESKNDPFWYARDFTTVYDVALRVLDSKGLTRFRGADSYFHSGISRIDTTDGRVTGFDNLRVAGPMALAGNTDGQVIMTDPLALHQRLPAPHEIFSSASAIPVPAELEYSIAGHRGKGSINASATSSFSDPNYLEPGAAKRSVVIDSIVISIETDVLIAGCGTSGVGAAYQAGALGLSPLVVDNALEIGGANTVGGVTNLWFGNPTKAFKDLYKACGATNDGCNAAPFFRGLEGIGASVLPYTPVCGTGYDGRQLRCVYVITPDGLTAIQARQFIDATGDGSLAAWSGSDYTFGSERDGVSSWGSFGSFLQGQPEAARQFLSMVDERSAKDTTRFIVAMRRSLRERLDGQAHVHPAFYVAPRTTRHLKATTTVTFADMLAGRRFKNGILRARSNIDTKGTETSNAFKAGFYPKERLAMFEVTIPYSSLVPENFDNLIISGKAYSITNDALTMARMQRDMFVLGIVAAEAVRSSLDESVALNDIQVERLQERLIDLGALKKADTADDDLGFPEIHSVLQSLIDSDTYEDALEPSAMLMVIGKEAVMPILETMVAPLTPALARLLCFWNVPRGMQFVRDEARRLLGEGHVSLDIYAVNHHAHLLPDHGFAPLPALMMNNVAQAGGLRAEEYVARIADDLDHIAQSQAALWAYLFGVAYMAERCARDSLVAPLKAILAHPVMSREPVRIGGDWRACADIDSERLVYLRLCVARALARCGSMDGVMTLVDFLDEARSAFAVNARHELMDVTGQDFGYDRSEWNDWMRRHPEDLAPTPMTTTFD